MKKKSHKIVNLILKMSQHSKNRHKNVNLGDKKWQTCEEKVTIITNEKNHKNINLIDKKWRTS